MITKSTAIKKLVTAETGDLIVSAIQYPQAKVTRPTKAKNHLALGSFSPFWSACNNSIGSLLKILKALIKYNHA